MIDTQAMSSFHDELDSIQKEALVGAIKALGKGISKRLGSAVSKTKKVPGSVHVKKVAPSPSAATGELQLLKDMGPQSQAAALRLKGPIGDAYRKADQAFRAERAATASTGKALGNRAAAAKASTTAPAAARPSMPGSAPSMPGASPSMPGAGAKTKVLGTKPSMPDAQLGATKVVSGPPKMPTGNAAREGIINKGIVTRQQSRVSPWKQQGGSGLRPEQFPRGKFMGRTPEGKAVFAHAMRKFAQLKYDSPLFTRIAG